MPDIYHFSWSPLQLLVAVLPSFRHWSISSSDATALVTSFKEERIFSSWRLGQRSDTHQPIWSMNTIENGVFGVVPEHLMEQSHLHVSNLLSISGALDDRDTWKYTYIGKWHITKWTILKCAIQRNLVHSHCCATTTYI